MTVGATVAYGHFSSRVYRRVDQVLVRDGVVLTPLAVTIATSERDGLCDTGHVPTS